MWYYYVGVERSVELFKALEVDDIPMRDESCAANLEDFLPEYLVIANGDFLEKRKNKKVLIYPIFKRCSYNFKYSMALLFASLQDESDLEEHLEDIFLKMSDENVRMTSLESTIRY